MPVILISRIKYRAIETLGLDRMSDKYRVLALNYVFFTAYYTLENIFVNTLLLRVTGGDMLTVLIYRSLTYIFTSLSMNLAAVFSRRMNSVTAILTGGWLYVLMFAVMFIWMERLSTLMYLVGMLSGLAMGLYWSGHSVLLTSYTTQENRSVGLSVNNVIQGTATLFIPLLSGFVIQHMPGLTGYRVMFGIAIATVLAQISFMRKLAPVNAVHRDKGFRFALGLTFKTASLRLMMLCEFLRGFRDGILGFFLNLLLFAIVDSESLVGFNSFLTGVASITAAWAYGRIATSGNRVKISAVSLIVLTVFCVPLLFILNPVTIILFSIINTFFALFLNISIINNSYDLVGGSDLTRSALTELMGFREVSLSMGRISGFVIVSMFPKTLKSYVLAIITLTAVQYLVAPVLLLSRRAAERERSLEAE